MTTIDTLYLLQHDIHSTVFAPLNHEGLPITCVVDIMVADIYPDEKSRTVLTVFQIYEGSEHCLHCGKCAEICPAGAVVKRGA